MRGMEVTVFTTVSTSSHRSLLILLLVGIKSWLLLCRRQSWGSFVDFSGNIPEFWGHSRYCINIQSFNAFGFRVLVRVYSRMRTRSCELNVIVLFFGCESPPAPYASMRNAQLIAGTGVPGVYTYSQEPMGS